MDQLVRRHPLIAYFGIAYAGSWLVWALFVLSAEGTGLLPFHAPASFLVLIGVGTFTGPMVAAFVVTTVTEGHDGVVRLLRRMVQWHVGLVWYAFVFLGLPAIETFGAVAMPGVAASFTPVDWLPELMATAVFFIYPAMLAGPLGEEIGWRGYALPRLQELHGPVKASLILGLLWAFWHSPIWFSGEWSEPTLPNIVVYVFWIVAVTFIFTWVFNNTQGSVLMAIPHTRHDGRRSRHTAVAALASCCDDDQRRRADAVLGPGARIRSLRAATRHLDGRPAGARPPWHLGLELVVDLVEGAGGRQPSLLVADEQGQILGHVAGFHRADAHALEAARQTPSTRSLRPSLARCAKARVHAKMEADGVGRRSAGPRCWRIVARDGAIAASALTILPVGGSSARGHPAERARGPGRRCPTARRRRSSCRPHVAPDHFMAEATMSSIRRCS